MRRTDRLKQISQRMAPLAQRGSRGGDKSLLLSTPYHLMAAGFAQPVHCCLEDPNLATSTCVTCDGPAVPGLVTGRQRGSRPQGGQPAAARCCSTKWLLPCRQRRVASCRPEGMHPGALGMRRQARPASPIGPPRRHLGDGKAGQRKHKHKGGTCAMEVACRHTDGLVARCWACAGGAVCGHRPRGG